MHQPISNIRIFIIYILAKHFFSLQLVYVYEVRERKLRRIQRNRLWTKSNLTKLNYCDIIGTLFLPHGWLPSRPDLPLATHRWTLSRIHLLSPSSRRSSCPGHWGAKMVVCWQIKINSHTEIPIMISYDSNQIYVQITLSYDRNNEDVQIDFS